jgi:hypothetical protein
MTTHPISTLLLAGLCLTVITPSPVLAGDPLIDNLGEQTRDRTEIATSFPPTIDLWAAQAFLPDLANYHLDSIQVILSEAVAGSIPIIELRRGPISPDTTIAALTPSSLPPGGDEIVTLTPDRPVTLVPCQVYWVVMGVQDPGYYKWAYAEGNNWNGPGAFGTYSYSFDSGASWVISGGENPYQMRVEVTPAQPPACYADCDADGTLSIDDFICFQTSFALGDLYSDCDVDCVLSIDDFICFQTFFAIGC